MRQIWKLSAKLVPFGHSLKFGRARSESGGFGGAVPVALLCLLLAWIAAPAHAQTAGASDKGPNAADIAADAPDAEAQREEDEFHLGAKPDWSWLKRLRFITTADYPPFSYDDEDGVLAGLNVDLARSICLDLRVECDIRAVEWANLIPMLESGGADAAVASIAITPKSLETLDFTDIYLQRPGRFVIRRGPEPAASAPTPEALEDKTVAVVKGTAHEAYLRTFFKDMRIKPFDSPQAARNALREGKADLLFGDAISEIFWINGALSQGCCQFLGGGFMEAKYFGEGAAIALKRGNLRLEEVLNYALARVRASGRFDELLLRYFPFRIY